MLARAAPAPAQVWAPRCDGFWPLVRAVHRALSHREDELVAAMAGPATELRSVTSRSHPMCACYPGGGARYVHHLDNPGGAGCNGRLLTCLYYLNPAWRGEDGGQLRLHRRGGCVVDVEPLLDRLVL